MSRSSPPSREANPFATCWTRPGALPYVEAETACPSGVISRLASTGWRGQLIGAHGSGKSTLLQEVAQRLNAQGVMAIDCDMTHEDDCPVAPRGAVLMVEGFERLSGRERSASLKRWRSRGLGFVVTAHRPIRDFLRPLPVLAVLRPSERLLRQLFGQLTAGCNTPVTWQDARSSFARRRGGLREVWFDLYDLHERRTREGRTAAVAVAYSAAGRLG